MVFFYHFLKGTAEIPYQSTADTAGIHLRNLNTGILKEAAVNADLSEFIFDQNNLLSWKNILYQLLDKCCLSCT